MLRGELMVTIEAPFEINTMKVAKQRLLMGRGICIEPNGHNGRSKDFRRVVDIKFCKGCGLINKKDIEICLCGSRLFLNGEVSEMLGGYLELGRNSLLRGYFLKKQGRKKGIGGMNQKRMIVWLLVHWDEIIKWDDNETIDVIYKAVRNSRNSRNIKNNGTNHANGRGDGVQLL